MHNWIAQHALDYLPNNEKKYIIDHLSTYLYGTELPDLNKSSGGIGDSTLHHIYFRSTGTLQDDAAAVRAYAEYNRSLSSRIVTSSRTERARGRTSSGRARM